MSIYQRGMAVSGQEPIRISTGAVESDNFSWGKVAAIGAVLIGLFVVVPRLGKKQTGPDTRDIEARIRARGLDPHKYGYGKG